MAAKDRTIRRIACSEIWGGIRDVDVDAQTGSLAASIYSAACDGGRGGDIYYISVCGADQLTRIAIADVVGHGQAVSQVSQWVYDIMAARMSNPDADELLADLNRQIYQRGFDALTTAAVIGFYKFDSHLYVSYAGHPPLLMCRAGERTWRVAGRRSLTERSNLPLGVAEKVEFLQDQIALEPGDRLVAYTDGVIEAPSPTGEGFGQARLMAALEQANGSDLAALKHRVLHAVRQHIGGPLRHDDTTLIAIEIR